MEAVHIFSEKLIHRRLTVCPLRPLKYNAGILFIQVVNADKGKPSQRSCFYKLLILQFAAHGHKLLIQFLYPFLIKIAGHL